MNEFASLLDPLEGELPSQAQVRARAGLRALVLNRFSGRFAWRDPDSAIPPSGRCIVLGVASYSQHDMRLLDSLSMALPGGSSGPPRVELFDVLDCRAESDFERFMPGIGEVRTEPVLALYSEGLLIAAAKGLAQVEKLLDQLFPRVGEWLYYSPGSASVISAGYRSHLKDAWPVIRDDRIRNVVICGGGMAGWMTASYLSKFLQGSVRITVLEAPSIPKIGVGETAMPSLQRVFFDFLDIREEEWMRECNASYAAAWKFINWRTPGIGMPDARTSLETGKLDHFYRPFGLLPDCDNIPLSHYWNLKRSKGEIDEAFDYACFVEPPFMDANLAPCSIDGRAVGRHAWHFDAHLVADFLRRYSTGSHGVIHVQDELDQVELHPETGHIVALTTRGGQRLEGDLFIDCSGFRGLLINKKLEEPFVDMSDHLLNDSAVATAVYHDDETYGVEPYTSAIAMSSGWTWKIPMLGRFGSGYVFSSKFSDHDQAAHDFCALWGLDPNKVPLNKIRFRVGRNRRAWVKNCVSIGLSSCFVEPLESTGIYFIYAAIYQLAKHFPDKRFDQILVDRYNREVQEMFDDTRDFLQTHFYFSPRMDTPFWRANKELHLADQIKEKIEMYKAGLPMTPAISDESLRLWTASNYYCIFAGLGLYPDVPSPRLERESGSMREAERVFAGIKREQQYLLANLPTLHERLVVLHGGDAFVKSFV